MRPDRSRTKKLVVAFHFQFSNLAGWKCDDCRRNGLEIKRRCGWLPGALNTPERVVWARGHASTTTCPRSFITAQSLAWLDAFHAWRGLGLRRTEEMEARQTEAFLILSNELGSDRGDRAMGA